MDRINFAGPFPMGGLPTDEPSEKPVAAAPRVGTLSRLAGLIAPDAAATATLPISLLAQPPPVVKPPEPDAVVGRPQIGAIAPGILPGLSIDPGALLPIFPLVPVAKTATQLARSAIALLSEVSADVVRDALNTISIKKLRPGGLLDYLERKVRVGEVLNQLARTWSETAGADFADAFQMDRKKTDVMDAIVSIAILNNPELDDEILAENLPDASTGDVVDNRVIVDQWPAAGTALNPPYLILVAVEYREIAQAQDVVRSITGELVEHEGTMLPRSVVRKLRG